MTWSPILAFAVVAMVFGFGDIVAAKSHGIINSILVAIIVFLILGGGMHLFPADLMNTSGLMDLIPTFGMALILVNVGSMLDLNDLRREWRTICISLAGVIGIIVIYLTMGSVLFGRELALAAMGPASGAMAATLMLTAAANEAGRADLAAFIAAVMALQILIGLPVASFCLRREANRFVAMGGHKTAIKEQEHKKWSIRIVPATPDVWNTPNIHLARIAIVGVAAYTVTQLTGISTGITYLVGGILFAALGIIEPYALKNAGGDSLLMLATCASVTASFVSMSMEQFGTMLIQVIGLLLIGAVGVCIFSVLLGLLLKWSPWLSMAVGICCMLGYPATYSVAMEIASGISREKELSEEEKGCLVRYLLPKMVVSGTISVSIASVLLAGAVIPVLF